MHGRKRSEYKALQRDPAVAAGLAGKAEKWHTLCREIATRRANGVEAEADAATSLALTEKMLLVNPDPIYLWNYRRELLLLSSKPPSNETAAGVVVACNCNLWSFERELQLTQGALQNNPKAYGAWFHRKWILSYHISNLSNANTTEKKKNDDKSREEVLSNELDLTELFLERDERNFHCWNYRRFVVSCLLGYGSVFPATTSRNNQDDEGKWWKSPQVGGGAKNGLPSSSNEQSNTDHDAVDETKKNQILETEWQFTNKKIQDNFSNFSAFHHRSKLLPWKVKACNEESVLVRSEWDLINNAIFTEPDDQTAWWYARFLLDFKRVQDTDDQEEWYKALLQEEIQQVRELAQEMPKSKWVCLGLHMLLEACGENKAELGDLLKRLIELDPDRRCRYEYLLSELQ